MSLAVGTLRKSFSRVIERSPNLTGRFYEILVTRYPQTKPLFAGPNGALDRRARELAGALAAVIARIEDAAWLRDTLVPMGARHLSYGLTDEMYVMAGDCLLLALAEAEGADWTPEVRQAWTAAYGAIATLMQEGARRAQAAA
jgi:hemoglobin-like flavoprotein